MSATSLVRLVPSGTARALFRRAGDADPDAGFPHELIKVLSARDVSDETLWAAWEVTTWAADAPAAERRGLACLMVALLQAIDSGGTFLPLGVSGAPLDGSNKTNQADPLGDRLRQLGLADADRQNTRALALALSRGSAPPAIAALVGPPGSRRPFVLSDGALYPERYWCLEEQLVTALRACMARRIPPFVDGSVDAQSAAMNGSKGATPLGDEQIGAVRLALTNPLTIIAGGPGTGKTSTIVGVLRTLARLGVPPSRIALAAPTGRAARRMKESVDAAIARLESPTQADADLISRLVGATTLHRLLGIRSSRIRVLEPDAPEFHADWPLPHQMVIVDEASMIDLDLMDRLVSAIGPGTRLLLIGDPNQLPSVQVGAVFRDLVAGAPDITSRLTQSHRMNPLDPGGAAILRVATSVNAGEALALAPTSDTTLHTHAADLAFSGFERLAPGGIDEFLERWHREILAGEKNRALALDRRYPVDETNRITSTASGGDDDNGAPDAADTAAVKTLADTLLSARILCVTREAGRTTSAAALNRLMHARFLAAAVATGAGEAWESAPFLPGEPVIALRNDQVRGLSNGDLGVVLRVRGPRGHGLGVAFPRGEGFMVHALDAIAGTLDLAFALTVHKAQGSEYDRVALVLPEVDVPLLTREVVYTALTRARHSVVVIGDPLFFRLAASRPIARTSGIAEKLEGFLVPNPR